MKQLPMTAELSALIKKAVGEDVDTTDLAVFETIALNTLPLPGKDGSIFESAVTPAVTLLQMVDSINAGNHLPLVADHELFGAPMGRFFHAGLRYDEDNTLEMRALFYLDPTEEKLITKLNSGSLDEVSVSFLSSQMLCSECGWDYFEFGSKKNFETRSCANGHAIGTDGVHVELTGLNKFIELSLVARGAADKPKIVGKSEAKLAPETAYRLAAKGFEPHALVCQASAGKKDEVMTDTTALMRDLVDANVKVTNLTAADAAKATEITQLKAANETLQGQVTQLTADLAAANEKNVVPEDYEPAKAELAEARTVLQTQLNALVVATGGTKLEGDALPTEITALKAKIEELTSNLTAILPVGGVTQKAGEEGKDVKLAFDPSAFSLRK